MTRARLTTCGVILLVLMLLGSGELWAKKPVKPPPEPPPAADPAIAFYDNGKLVVMDADGANRTVVFDSGGEYRDLSQPDWSPDGTKLVFGYAGGADGPGIYTINVDGTGLTRLVGTTGLVIGTNPAWSPGPVPGVGGNRYRIAYSDETIPGWYDLYIVDVDGSNRVQLTNTPLNFESGATWSPSATKLATGAWSGPDVYWGLYDFTTGTYSVREFAGALAGLRIGGPVWAKTPANAHLIAWSGRGEQDVGNDIWIQDLSNPSATRRLTNTPDVHDWGPSWSPDDAHIVLRSVGQTNKLRKIDDFDIVKVSDSSRENIADGGSGLGGPVWKR